MRCININFNKFFFFDSSYLESKSSHLLISHIFVAVCTRWRRVETLADIVNMGLSPASGSFPQPAHIEARVGVEHKSVPQCHNANQKAICRQFICRVDAGAGEAIQLLRVA